MASVSVGTIIEYAKISQFLSDLSNKKDRLFKNGVLDKDLPRLLYFVRSGVEWLYDADPTDVSLIATGNYLYSLCGRYIPQAQTLFGNVGGEIIAPPIGQTSTIIPILVQFTVGAGELMEQGDTVLTLNYQNVLLNSVSVVKDGVPLPINVGNQQSFAVVYSTNSIELTFNEAVQDGQLFIIRGLRFV